MKREVFVGKMQEVFPHRRLLVVLLVIVTGALTQSCNPNPPKAPDPAPYKVPAPRIDSDSASQTGSQADARADSQTNAKTHR